MLRGQRGGGAGKWVCSGDGGTLVKWVGSGPGPGLQMPGPIWTRREGRSWGPSGQPSRRSPLYRNWGPANMPVMGAPSGTRTCSQLCCVWSPPPSHTQKHRANWRAVCGIWGQSLCTALRWGLYLPGYNRNKACHQKRWSHVLKY